MRFVADNLRFLAYGGTVVTPMFTLAVFTFIAEARGNHVTLTNEMAITSLILFNLFGSPMSLLIDAISGVALALSSLQRIQEYLCEDAQVDEKSGATYSSMEAQPPPSPDHSAYDSEGHIALGKLSPRSDSPVAALEELVCCSSRNLNVFRKPGGDVLLRNLNFSIRQSQLTIIIGPVGCGKSVFLKLLLGEMPTTGQVRRSFTNAAYCSQSVWLMNQSIKQNILGPFRWDPDWYNKVVHACCLEYDFKLLPLNDETIVGNRGAALSGGQQKRVVRPPPPSAVQFPFRNVAIDNRYCTRH